MSHRIVLIGAPNAGKTTLFNWLTGSKFKAVNYPGSTVDIAEGETDEKFGDPLFVTDTPGTYSLFPKSLDEKIAIESLFSHPTYGAASLVLAVVDANQLSRHLFLVSQLKESGFRTVVAVTNIDLLTQSGRSLDVKALSDRLRSPVVAINGQIGEGVPQLVEACRASLASSAAEVRRPERWTKEKCERTFLELMRLAQDVTEPTSQAGRRSSALEQTHRIDNVLMHPVLGLLLFVAFMTALFSSIFWAASPLMDAIDGAFAWLASWVGGNVSNKLMADFLSNGVVAGLGSVLVFLPQIAILTFGISFFEDSGYLARAAALIDRPMAMIGLNGRSFVPLLSGFACAIPAMMAARTISSRKEKFLTLFIIPLMSCSARLPVYSLLLAFLFKGQPAWIPGLALTALYFLSLFVGALAAIIASRMLKMDRTGFFALELPVYRRPKLRVVLHQVWSKVVAYIFKAGPIIFILSMAIWSACTFPAHQIEDPSERLQSSYAAAAGRMLEPLMEPMGLDWRVGIGLISAFAAREVFVSAMAVVFNITTEDEEGLRDSLLTTMAEAKNSSGEALFTAGSVAGLILFFMIALQCMATFGVARREFGSWRWAVAQLVIFNGVAYGLAVVVNSFL